MLCFSVSAVMASDEKFIYSCFLKLLARKALPREYVRKYEILCMSQE
jgi:hypothetical protein